ncbi:MAG: GNAT family N-acetyltransferase [Alphaproteobacteria bacterium]|nr:MAG: GNAT family N-acetyltransferase [Alphaproteobacteria bacterium]
MTYTHRPLILTDRIVLKDLLLDLGYPQTEESLTTIMQTYTNEREYYAYVAMSEGIVCGVIAWHMRRLFVNARLKVSIEGLVVNPRMHRRGVGQYLMGIVEVFARNEGVWVIDLTSGRYRASSGAHAFYQSLGYDNTGMGEKIYLRKIIKQ